MNTERSGDVFPFCCHFSSVHSGLTKVFYRTLGVMSTVNSKLGTTMGAVLGFVGLSAAAGVMVATMMTPAIALTGLAANSTISIFDSLPDYIQIGELAKPSVLMAKQGDEDIVLATF